MRKYHKKHRIRNAFLNPSNNENKLATLINQVDGSDSDQARIAQLVENLLLEYNTSIDQQDEQGKSALHLCARYGYAEILNVLIQHGANIELKDENSWTALFWASEFGHTDVVAILLLQGVNTHQRDMSSNTALIRAAGAGHVDVVRLLLDHGVSIEQRRNENRPYTGLIAAACNFQHRMVNYLLIRGAYLHIDSLRKNFNMIASQSNNNSTLLNIENDYYSSLLFIAENSLSSACRKFQEKTGLNYELNKVNKTALIALIDNCLQYFSLERIDENIDQLTSKLALVLDDSLILYKNKLVIKDNNKKNLVPKKIYNSSELRQTIIQSVSEILGKECHRGRYSVLSLRAFCMSAVRWAMDEKWCGSALVIKSKGFISRFKFFRSSKSVIDISELLASHLKFVLKDDKCFDYFDDISEGERFSLLRNIKNTFLQQMTVGKGGKVFVEKVIVTNFDELARHIYPVTRQYRSSRNLGSLEKRVDLSSAGILSTYSEASIESPPPSYHSQQEIQENQPKEQQHIDVMLPSNSSMQNDQNNVDLLKLRILRRIASCNLIGDLLDQFIFENLDHPDIKGDFEFKRRAFQTRVPEYTPMIWNNRVEVDMLLNDHSALRRIDENSPCQATYLNYFE